MEKFIHSCMNKVYANKKCNLMNKCIINIKTFDDNFIHSTTIELLLNVTIDKHLMIKIFFFFCKKNFLLSSFFHSEENIINHEFFSKNISINKPSNNFIIDIMKPYKCQNITNLILNNNFVLLQNLLDYFYMICSTRNMSFYDNFFLNIQMINFIYPVQLNVFHFYYMKLYKKFNHQRHVYHQRINFKPILFYSNTSNIIILMKKKKQNITKHNYNEKKQKKTKLIPSLDNSAIHNSDKSKNIYINNTKEFTNNYTNSILSISKNNLNNQMSYLNKKMITNEGNYQNRATSHSRYNYEKIYTRYTNFIIGKIIYDRFNIKGFITEQINKYFYKDYKPNYITTTTIIINVKKINESKEDNNYYQPKEFVNRNNFNLYPTYMEHTHNYLQLLGNKEKKKGVHDYYKDVNKEPYNDISMDCYKHMDVDNYNHIDIDNYNHIDIDNYNHVDIDNYNHVDIDNYNHVDIDNYKHINKESYNDTYNYYKELRTRHNSYNNIQSDDHYDNNLKRVDTNNEVLLLSNDILKYDLTNDNNIDKNKTNSYNDMKKRNDSTGNDNDNDNDNNDYIYFLTNKSDYNFLNKYDYFHMNKILKVFNFIFNLLECTLHNNDVSIFNYNKDTTYTFDERVYKNELILDNNNYENKNITNIRNYIKEIVYKIELYFTSIKNKYVQRFENIQDIQNMENAPDEQYIKNVVKDIDRSRFRNLLHDTKLNKSLKYNDQYNSFFSFEFLYLAYICSNSFPDNISKNYKNLLFKNFNFNEIWLTSHQIKIKIFISLMYMSLYEINSMNLGEFFMEILKIILHRFYNNLDYNDIQIIQYIFLNISNDTLFSCYNMIDDIKDIIRKIPQISNREFFYVYNLYETKNILQNYQNNLDKGDTKDKFINRLLNYLIKKKHEIENKKQNLKEIHNVVNNNINEKKKLSNTLGTNGKINNNMTNEMDEYTIKDHMHDISNGSYDTQWKETMLQVDILKEEQIIIHNQTKDDNINLYIDGNILCHNLSEHDYANETYQEFKEIEEFEKFEDFQELEDFEEFEDFEELFANNNTYTFDFFLTEKCLEKNDFVFFKKCNKGKHQNNYSDQHPCGSSFFFNMLNHLKECDTDGKKKNKKKKLKREGEKKLKMKGEKKNNTLDEHIVTTKKKKKREKNILHIPMNNTNDEFTLTPKKNKYLRNVDDDINKKYKLIWNYFKINKEIYIDNFIDEKVESIINIQKYGYKLNYYENTKVEYYQHYSFQKHFNIPEEISETYSVLIALNRSIRDNNLFLSFENNNYVNTCLNLLYIIDLYMEFKSNIFNKPFYFIKNLIIMCANISFSKELTIIYINALIRFCLFELRMDNLFISSNMLIEILNNFEKIKNYKNLLGIIFYLCGYILLQHLNYNIQEQCYEENKNALIDEYNYYVLMKKNYINTFQKIKMEKSHLKKKKNYFEQFLKHTRDELYNLNNTPLFFQENGKNVISSKKEKVKDKMDHYAKGKLNEKLDEHLNEKVDDHLNEKVDDHLNEKVDDHLNEHLNEKLDEHLDEHLNEHLNEHLDEYSYSNQQSNKNKSNLGTYIYLPN
ncbi:hypothetical protein PFTANZ_05304, partial [Plasmodium falciparum Tanzania (2000708)]